MKKPLLQFLSFALVFLISGISSSFSQERESANPIKTQPKKTKSNITYLDSYIQQPNVENCFLVTVIFEIEDEAGNPITDAIVTLNDVENTSGDYIFNGIEEGTYNYTVSNDGYISVDGEVVVTLESSEHSVSITLVVQTFTITFSIVGVDENEITDAVVTFNGVENDAGDYTFEGIEAGTYDYKVEKDGYITVEDQHTVSEDATVNITLVVETFTITFSIVDVDENEITDAVITFNGAENDAGDYTFEGIEAGTYDYKVEKEGYTTVDDQAEVIDQNLTVNVTLTDATSAPVNPLAQQWISLFPNPNTGQFTIELSLMPSENSLWLTVLDPTGRVVHRVHENAQGETFTKELNLSFLSKGIYYIHVQGNQRTGVRKLIIN